MSVLCFGVACSHQETIIPVTVGGKLCHPNRDRKFEFVIASHQERKGVTRNAGDSTGQVRIQNTSETTGINHYRE